MENGLDLIDRASAGDPTAIALAMAARIAANEWDEATKQAVSRAFMVVLRAGGAISFDRAFGMPNSPGRMRRASRDHWLSMAARHMTTGSSVWAGCQALADEWAQYVSRGPWARYKAPRRAEPPDDMSDELGRALWWASHFNGGRGLSAMRLREIPAVFGVLSEKAKACRPMLRTVNSAKGTHR